LSGWQRGAGCGVLRGKCWFGASEWQRDASLNGVESQRGASVEEGGWQWGAGWRGVGDGGLDWWHGFPSRSIMLIASTTC
jgi:hypothetical protein